MDFEDGTGGRAMRLEFKGKSTMDLVLDGYRTATSRTYILDVKEGDQVLFEDRFGRRALVEVTKAPYKVSEITSEEWSALEGWDKSVYKPNFYQYQFKLLAGTSTADALTSYERPLKIFTDGSSVQDKQILGYGAYFVFANEEYKMSGNAIDVNRILNNYKEDFTIEDLLKVSKNPSPTMELMGILETLRKFSNTSEHLYILTDQENNVNYEGIWEHTFVNEHIPSAKEKVNGKRTKSTKPNTTGSSPWLEYLVPEIVKQIEKIEANGGSVRFQWIPGHINDDAVNKYPHAFADKEGATSRDVVDQYQKGNDNADILAKSTGRESNLKKLHAPKRESIEMLRTKAEEKYQDRSASGNEIC
jgi:ribonuclease HI